MTNICTPDETYVNYKVSENFWFSELIHSNTADKHGIDNYPSDSVKKNLEDSCKYLWQPARDVLGKPVSPSCAHRCKLVNKLVGGSDSSAHVHGFAMDFTAPSFGRPKDIVKKLVIEFRKKGIKWDQMILEYPDSKTGGWVHLAWKNSQGKQRCQTLLKTNKINYRSVDFTKL